MIGQLGLLLKEEYSLPVRCQATAAFFVLGHRQNTTKTEHVRQFGGTASLKKANLN
jgi:hypothetical protein